MSNKLKFTLFARVPIENEKDPNHDSTLGSSYSKEEVQKNEHFPGKKQKQINTAQSYNLKL